MEQLEIKETKIQVRHHNVITNARHELSAVQLDIYFMMLSRLKPGDSKDTKYIISVKEIEELTGRQWNYQQLREATAGLIGKVFEIEEEDGLLQVAMMSSAKYLKGQGRIQLSIAEDLKPYLVDLKNNFTSFQLFCVLSMTSKYAKWLYVQFSRWKDLGAMTFEVEQLRYRLNLKDPSGKAPEQYKQWGQFKDYVLEPAIRQINEVSDLRVAYAVTEKKGKSIHKLTFTIKMVSQVQTVIPFESEELDREAAQLKGRLRDIGILDTNLINKILNSTELRKKANKCLYDISLRRKDINNPGGYFRTTLGI
ncbi:replication initiation protein (plasmid) [Adhaeribacter swui]|uniref:Replication initiation protein n=2 Tax=Adhaeribacter TaxID=299566 RepID=A0A7L7L1C5_9BACT|nr:MULTISPECIES: replication initiation protein [Adhaeribacter]QMU26581.1 replication initiation protein [Adhaeribacter radiodurans]QNF31289.1 replication initiation protein [Adhaeribacter swui]